MVYLCVACGLRCYSCMNADSKSCAKIATCASTQDRCSSTEVMGKLFFHTRSICSCTLTFQIDCLSESKLIFFCSIDIVETNCMFFSLYWGLVTKHCINSAACVGLIKCCEGDLCNGAIPTGSSILLLLVSAAITSVFLWNFGVYSTFFFVNLYNSGKQLWLKIDPESLNKITEWLTFVLFNSLGSAFTPLISEEEYFVISTFALFSDSISKIVYM